MNDIQTPDNTEPGISKRREADLVSKSEEIDRIMKLFEDEKFLASVQKLLDETNVEAAVAEIRAANERLAAADLGPEITSRFTNALVEGVKDRNTQKPLDVLQGGRETFGATAPNAWDEAAQKAFTEALVKNNVVVRPVAPPAPAPTA